jgi:hypothetical protein
MLTYTLFEGGGALESAHRRATFARERASGQGHLSGVERRQAYADVCSRMLTYAHVSSRERASGQGHVSGFDRKQPYADEC